MKQENETRERNKKLENRSRSRTETTPNEAEPQTSKTTKSKSVRNNHKQAERNHTETSSTKEVGDCLTDVSVGRKRSRNSQGGRSFGSKQTSKLKMVAVK